MTATTITTTTTPTPTPTPKTTGPLTVSLPSGPGAPSLARRATAAFLHGAWPALSPERRDDFLLIVSELVTNAVRHAPGPSTLTLTTASGALDISVTDHSRVPPVPRAPDRTEGTGGMGLHIAEDLGASVYTQTLPEGKCVHAAFAAV
ncbi:ATP-binding protein [Streptomyces sp. NBC_00102]|uniref:ATP-binding protein n=1 Tax=Streptomyces sp. NBC_00102 TaxID=2975652 RepID=UPI0022514CE0|nr:ATP-binding protein [Streptomyces sp. NBC_00102]MCX5402029.1 ATP-binding protein [Streptomyces sp. NBC_00102]